VEKEKSVGRGSELLQAGGQILTSPHRKFWWGAAERASRNSDPCKSGDGVGTLGRLRGR